MKSLTEDAFAKAQMLLDLADSTYYCALKHGPGEIVPPPVDYIVIPIGNTKTGEVIHELTIPVCEECAEALYGKEWVLLLCLRCSASQWVCRELAKLKYFHKASGKFYHIIGLHGCPDCNGEFGGLYFLDY